MFTRSGFSAQQQFHLLISINNHERSITVLPDHKGGFLIIDQGAVLGQLGFDKHFNFIPQICKMAGELISQLIDAIKLHYRPVKGQVYFALL